MASTTQPPAPVAQSMSAPTFTQTTPVTASPNHTRPNSAHPRGGHLNYSAHKAKSPLLAKQYLSPQIELTGAAAAAENALVHERQSQPQPPPPMKSLNPAYNPFGPSSLQSMSKATDAPAQPAKLLRSNDPAGPAVQTSRRSSAGTRRSSNNQNLTPVNTTTTRLDDGARNVQQTNGPSPTTATSGRSNNNMFASPEVDEPKQLEASPRSSEGNPRKRALPPSPKPTYSTYPPISTPAASQAAAARNASLPHSGSNRSPAVGVKKHKCHHCNTEFTRQHNLKSHLLTHSQEKPFGCDQCDARFRRLHDLKRHLKLHTGERPHQCEVCKRAFARGDALARHSKGPGGCAGRRESAIGDDGMSVSDEEDEEREAQAESDRRKSEPNKRARRGTASGRPSLGGQDQDPRIQGRTYPPVAAMSGQHQFNSYSSQRPSSRGGSTAGQRGQASSPRSQQPPFTAPRFDQGMSSVFAQGGVTASPGPLSPGQTDPNARRQSDVQTGGQNHSPSISTRMQQTQFYRGSVGGNTSQQDLSSSMQADQRYAPHHQQSQQGSRLPPPTLSTRASIGGSHPNSNAPSATTTPHPNNYTTSHPNTSTQSLGSYTSSVPTNDIGRLLTVVNELSESLRMKDAECNELRQRLQMFQEQQQQMQHQSQREREELSRLVHENQILRGLVQEGQGHRGSTGR